MAKKKLKVNRKTGEPTGRAAAWLASIDPLKRAWWLRRVLLGAAGISVCLGAGAGLLHLEKYVHADARYDQMLHLDWTADQTLPAWLQLADNAHILQTLSRRANLQFDDRLLDASLAKRIGTALAAPDSGWIESVERVSVRPDGVVSVKCKFRKPSSWVAYGRQYYLIDEQGVRLPGRYDPVTCGTSSLMVIDGVKSPPPEIGHAWDGGDVRAGAKLVSLLTDRPFRHQVSRISVENYNGRLANSRPQIELVTDLRNARIWWGRAPDEEYGMEIKASQKVALLDALYRESGRIDMNRTRIDITTWPDRVAMPTNDGAAAVRGALRG